MKTYKAAIYGKNGQVAEVELPDYSDKFKLVFKNPVQGEKKGDTAVTVLYCKYCDKVFGRRETHEGYIKNGTDFVCDLCKQINVKLRED